MNNFDELELLVQENTLKSLELWLQQQYLEIAKKREALQAMEDRITETADEVRAEMLEGSDV
jgi:uncharacterized coiled-coil protein SlyX